MISLTRQFRFALPDPNTDPNTDPKRTSNSWAGWFGSNRVRPYLELEMTVRGEIDNRSGYLINIKRLDDFLHDFVVKKTNDGTLILTGEQILLSALDYVTTRLPATLTLSRLQLNVSPQMHFFVSLDEQDEKAMTTVSLTEQFEFSAAHRLHCAELTDEENLQLFGKCNNKEGHGHNYVVEVTVEKEVTAPDGQVVQMDFFEQTVKAKVIDRLDHKHLNRDIEEFKELNPTVENISITIWDWLQNAFGDAKLKSIRVYETPKTWAEFRGHQS